ncbi:MAG: ComF family protein [Clostridia bacterium]|nr:ComF family protein [Clostridia bacterium]
MMQTFINLIYPKVCGICGEISKEDICNKCKVRIKKWQRNKKHIYLTKNFTTHMYIFDYQDIIRQRILEYKFYEKTYLFRSFVKIILNDKKICGFLKSYDIIIPVPISKKRKRQRGYNQSEMIAKQIAKQTEKLEYRSDILYKIKDTLPQSLLNKEKREQNIQGAYYIKKEEIVQNKKILLLDDIYTTGNTVNECSRILKQAGTKEIGVLTLAKD